MCLSSLFCTYLLNPRLSYSALMESLITPLQDKIEDWKKTANQLDKDHAKGKQAMMLTHETNVLLSSSPISGTLWVYCTSKTKTYDPVSQIWSIFPWFWRLIRFQTAQLHISG